MYLAFIVVFILFILPSLYIIFNVFLSKQVEAKFVEYEGQRTFGQGQVYGFFFPVYQYIYNGKERTYKSAMDLYVPFVKKPVKKLYIRKDGKIFDLRFALTILGLGLVLLVLVKMGMFGC